MLFIKVIKGVKRARIKTYKQLDHQCKNCKDFDLTITVYQDYYHAYHIPMVASGIKTSVIQCNRCGSQFGSAALSEEYEAKTKIPFYLYSGVILAGLFLVFLAGVSLWGQRERAMYIAEPKIGDVYLVDGKADEYNFLRVKRVTGDSVIACYNHLTYLTFPSSLSSGDYFDTHNEVGYSKAGIKQLYDKGTIETIYRDYDEATGFNRVN